MNEAPRPPHVAHAPLEGTARFWGTIALSAATFMNVLDTSIANVSLPAIAGDLGVSPNQGTWVITSFAVANAIAVPLTGWLSQRFGQVRLFVLSVILFVMASWLCGLAPNMPCLIAFRALQGFVAGPMIPLSQTLLLASYPSVLAGSAMAAWAMTTLIAPLTGPLLGGWITDNISWPWIFYINIPIGIVAAGASWLIYRKRDSAIKVLPIDRIGLSLLVIWVGAMQLMLDLGKENDWFASSTIITLLLIALIGFTFFLIWELHDAHPVVDLHLFNQRNFWVGVLSTSIGYGLFFANIVLVPLWLQQFMGYTATQAGIVTAPTGIFALLLSPYVGKNINRIDPRRFASISFIVFALILWMRAQFNTQADIATLMIPTIIQGIGTACFFIPLTTITLSGLPPELIPAASGLSNFTRITFGAIGTSVVTTVWENRSALHHAQLVENLHQGNSIFTSTLEGLSAAGMTPQQALAQINRLIDQQAAMLAANDVFYASTWLFLLLIPVIWLSHPTHGKADSAAAAGAH